MRKYLFTILAALCLCGTLANAQTYVGGSISFGVNTNDGSTASSLSISPDFGRFMHDNLALGIRPVLGVSSAHSNGSLIVGATPYVQYRLFDYKRFGLWAEAALDFNWRRMESPESVIHQTSLGLEALPVLSFDLWDHVRLYTRLEVFSAYLSSSYDDFTDRSSFMAGLGVRANDVYSLIDGACIGFIYIF